MWCGDWWLCDCFPSFYLLTVNKASLVVLNVDHLLQQVERCEMERLLELLDCLDLIFILRTVVDTDVW